MVHVWGMVLITDLTTSCTMKPIQTLLIISAALLLNGCTGTNGADNMSSASTVLIPDLPARMTTVGVPGEADRLRTTFTDLKQRLTTQPDDLTG